MLIPHPLILPSQMPCGRIHFSIAPLDAQYIPFTQFPSHTLFYPVILACDDNKLVVSHWFHSIDGSIFYFLIELHFTVSENVFSLSSQPPAPRWDPASRRALLSHASPRLYASFPVLEADENSTPLPPVAELE